MPSTWDSGTWDTATFDTSTSGTAADTPPVGVKMGLWALDWEAGETASFLSDEYLSGPSVLLVVGDKSALTTGDVLIRDRLKSLGFGGGVYYASDEDAVPSDVTTKALIVVSSSTSATVLLTKYATTAVPLLDIDAGSWDDQNLITAPPVANNGTTMRIIDASHPAAGGLSGTVTYTNNTAAVLPYGGSLGPGGWGYADNGFSGNWTALSYSAGVAMANGVSAPARRIGLSLWPTAIEAGGGLSSNGWLLFDSAVKWATQTPVTASSGGTFNETVGTADSIVEVSAYVRPVRRVVVGT